MHLRAPMIILALFLMSLAPPGTQADVSPIVLNEDPVPSDGIRFELVSLPTVAYIDGIQSLSLLGEENDVDYTRILIENTSFTREPGRPMVPEVPILFVVPPTALNVTGVSYTSNPDVRSPQELTSRKVMPVQYPDSDNRSGIPIQDNTTYTASAWYPSDVASVTSEGFIDGYRIVSVVVHPVQYNPATDEIRVHRDLTVEVQYDPDPNWTPETAARDGILDRIVKGMVANPGQIEAFYGTSAVGTGCVSAPSADAALLVPEVDPARSAGLRAALEAYAARRTVTGMSTIAVPVDVTAGASTIRGVIEDLRCTEGIRTFILGGAGHPALPLEREDPPVFPTWYEEMPTKNLRKPDGLIAENLSRNVTSDWEYALLDSPLGRDPFPDVVIGRLPFWSATQVLEYQHRVESYERANVSGLQNRATYTNAYLLGAHYQEGGAQTNTDGRAVSTVIAAHLDSSSGTFNVHMDEPDISPPRINTDVKTVLDGDGADLDPPVELGGGVGYTNLATDGKHHTSALANRQGVDTASKFIRSEHLTGYPTDAAHVLYSLSTGGGVVDPRSRDPNGPSPGLVPFSITPTKGIVVGIGNAADFLYLFEAGGAAPTEELNANFYRFLADSQPRGIAQQGLGAVLFSAKATLIAQSEEEKRSLSHAGFGWTLRSFNLFGDPTLVPWTREPQTTSAEYTPYVQPGAHMKLALDLDLAYLPNEVHVRLGNRSITQLIDGPTTLNITAPNAPGNTTLAIRIGHHALHVASVLVDATPPSVEVLNLTSHPDPAARYSDRTVVAEVVAFDNGHLEGFAVLTSQDPNGVPENVFTHQDTPLAATVSADGMWYLHVRPIDAAGNWGETWTRSFSVDTTPPASWLDLTGEGDLDPSDPWFRTDVTVTMQAVDGWDGLTPASMSIGTDPTNLTAYQSPVSVTTEGAHRYYFQSSDAAILTNVEPRQDHTFGIDREAPVASWMSSPPREGLNESFAVSWGADDDLSGAFLYTVEARKIGGPWATWQNNTTATSATYNGTRGETYEFRVAATDRAGNQLGAPTLPQTSTYVNLAPLADAGGNQTVSYEQNTLTGVSFNGSGSVDPDGVVVFWEWDFGDGSAFATGETVTHKYAETGNYVVRLRVVDDDGLDGESNAWIQIKVEIVHGTTG